MSRISGRWGEQLLAGDREAALDLIERYDVESVDQAMAHVPAGTVDQRRAARAAIRDALAGRCAVRDLLAA